MQSSVNAVSGGCCRRWLVLRFLSDSLLDLWLVHTSHNKLIWLPTFPTHSLCHRHCLH